MSGKKNTFEWLVKFIFGCRLETIYNDFSVMFDLFSQPCSGITLRLKCKPICNTNKICQIKTLSLEFIYTEIINIILALCLV